MSQQDILNMDTGETLEEVKKPFIIMEGAIKDDFCHFKFQVNDGIGVGNLVGVEGKHVVKEDMKTAFAKFNVHLAVIDDVFKHSKTEIDDVDKFHNHELATLYTVTGFKIKESGGEESISLEGYKYVAGGVGGLLSLKTPRVPLGELSSYKWYNELTTALEDARKEIELYYGGKYELDEDEKEAAQRKADPNQLDIFSGSEKKRGRKKKDAEVTDPFASPESIHIAPAGGDFSNFGAETITQEIPDNSESGQILDPDFEDAKL